MRTPCASTEREINREGEGRAVHKTKSLRDRGVEEN